MLTKIEWCDYTWNPWRGCRKVSEGCVFCYITDTAPLRSIHYQHGSLRIRASQAVWDAPRRWAKQPWLCDGCGHAHTAAYVQEAMVIRNGEQRRLGDLGCLGCGKFHTFHRARVFLGSLMDIFDDEVALPWFADALGVVRECPELDFLMVTKRPELWRPRVQRILRILSDPAATWLHDWLEGRPPGNVWVIASAENQKMLDKRAPELLAIPAVLHGLSCEPLLEALKLARHVPGVDWVIAGGESHRDRRQARRCHVEWLRDIQEQCAKAGVAYFCKQFGSNSVQDLSYAIPESDITDEELEPADIAAWEDHRHNASLFLKDKKGGDMAEWPDAKMRVRQWPSPRLTPIAKGGGGGL